MDTELHHKSFTLPDVVERRLNREETGIVCINQSIDYEKCIKEMPNLNEILIIEDSTNSVQKIKLKRKNAAKLKKLILYSNGLTRIPNLTKVTFLEVLFLADNNISSIIGLEHLHFLKELNLSKNAISFIDRHLQRNVNLEILNLSANPIRYLENIANIFHVKSLEKLFLADPLYGECPITSHQCYYRLQIIHYMPSLKELDGFSIDSHDRKQGQRFINNFILQYETQYEQLRSKFKYEEEIILKSFLNEMEMFSNMQKSYKGHSTNNKSQFLESQHKVLMHGIRNLKIQFKDSLRELNERRLLRETQCIIEKESFGNILIKPLIKPEIREIFNNVLRSCLCYSSEKRNLFKDISVSNVTFLGRQVENEYVCDHENNCKHCTFYLLKCPFKVSNLNKWREILLRNFPLSESQNMVVTNCLISCDIEYLGNVVQDYMRPPCKETRVAILVKTTYENNILSQNKVSDHLGADGDTSSCQEWCVCNDECVYYAVEYYYELRDKYELIRDISTPKKLLEPSKKLCKPISLLSSHIKQNLTSVSLSGCNIYNVGSETEVFVHVMDLDLSFNEFSSINPLLTTFPNLRQLNISHNSLSQLRATKSINSIEILDISWNKLSSFLDLSKFLPTSMTNLKCLNIEFNPLEDVIDDACQAYFMEDLFQCLEQFNDIKFDKEKIKHDVQINDVLNENEIIFNSSDLTNQLHFTTLGLINKLENNRAPQHLIKFKNDTSGELKGICVKSSFSLKSITLVSPSIHWIAIRHNCLSNLKFVVPLTNLQELYLSHNKIQNINMNWNLVPNIKKLDLSDNFIQNLISFRNAKLHHLRYLNISGNFIEYLHDIVHLRSIEHLHVSWNKIKEDLTNLRRINTLVLLKSIDITGNPLNNISNIKNFIFRNYPNIQYINGEKINFENEKHTTEVNNITLDLAYLLKTYNRPEVTNLTELTVSNASLKRIELSKDIVPNLVSINLERNDIEFISGVCQLPNLKILRLSYNKIKEFQDDMSSGDSIRIFEKLETLYLDHNDIELVDTFNMSAYQNLKYLFLHSNKISDLRGLEETKKVRVLVLDKNEITQIPKMFFVKHKFLNQLYLESNKLQDLKFTRNITSPLKKIFLAYNRIKDFQTLEHLKSLKRLNEITLIGNNISRKSDYHSKVIRALDHVRYLDGHCVQFTNIDE